MNKIFISMVVFTIMASPLPYMVVNAQTYNADAGQQNQTMGLPFLGADWASHGTLSANPGLPNTGGTNTNTPGLPNTGAGGNLLLNTALALGSLIAMTLGIVFLRKEKRV